MYLTYTRVLFVFVSLSHFGSNSEFTGSGGVIHSRRKRYVAFPEGASITMALCMSVQALAPFRIFTEGVNWGISYDLPNATTFTDYKTRYKSDFLLKRRQRRDIYNRIEDVINAMGFDGRSCIFRAICEASRDMKDREITLSEELLRILFRFPHEAVLMSEPKDHRLYQWAYKRGRDNVQQDCSVMYPACSISLIDLALGYYNHHPQEVQPSMLDIYQ